MGKDLADWGEGVPDAPVPERLIEDYFVRRVKRLGGRVYKLQFLGRRGAPDRLVLFSDGLVFFVELKRPRRGSLSPAQSEIKADFNRLGTPVYVLKSRMEIDKWLANVLI
jgi:hypothetical protein